MDKGHPLRGQLVYSGTRGESSQGPACLHGGTGFDFSLTSDLGGVGGTAHGVHGPSLSSPHSLPAPPCRGETEAQRGLQGQKSRSEEGHVFRPRVDGERLSRYSLVLATFLPFLGTLAQRGQEPCWAHTACPEPRAQATCSSSLCSFPPHHEIESRRCSFRF